jgi:alkanesulfonate monooxygenase SsuD/methylene tetrahydromethanopterin reductase-like flavin-dependent oxidoreductase (luciferase family)
MPVLFQAGSSGRGREFAARHAECVFLQGTTAPAVAASVADIRTRAVGYGREGDDIKILVGLSTIIGETDEDARRKFEQFQALSTDETAAAQFAYNTGIDLMSYDLDRPLPADVSTEQGRTNVERFMGGDGRPPHTVRQILDEMKARGLRGLLLTGTAASVADQIESYVSATGVDGFLLESYINPGSYDDIAQLLLPVLRARGLAPEPYTTTTLRERFAGAGNPHLADTHPGAAYRPRRAASV